MSLTSPELIAAIHQSGRQGVIAVTGGGSPAISSLLSVPGASRFLLEARVPYASAALAEWLTREPEQACSRETALAMAVVAYQRACHLTSNCDVATGVGCTAALVSDRPKRGAHRAWVATQTSSTTRLVELTLDKGRRDRPAEERAVADALLWLLGKSCGLTSVPDLTIQDGDSLSEESVEAHPLLRELFCHQRKVVWNVCPDNNATARVWQEQPETQPRTLLSGSFNPLHEGHRELARAAERRIGGSVAFELAWINVDKPPLDFLTIESRCRQFEDSLVVLTRAPTFREKSRLFPGMTFVVGVDTAERILHPKYYASEIDMLAALDEIRSHACQFLVAGRIAGNRFATLADLNLPAAACELFMELPESEFRRDLSSTELRQQQAQSKR